MTPLNVSSLNYRSHREPRQLLPGASILLSNMAAIKAREQEQERKRLMDALAKEIKQVTEERNRQQKQHQQQPKRHK